MGPIITSRVTVRLTPGGTRGSAKASCLVVHSCNIQKLPEESEVDVGKTAWYAATCPIPLATPFTNLVT